MKAILIKVLPATNTKPRRCKYMAEGVEAHVGSYCDGDARKEAAEHFAQRLGWLKDGDHMAHGMLPNGDDVACFTS